MPIFTSIADIRASAAHLGLSSNNSGLNTNAKPSPPADEGFELEKAGGKVDDDLEILPAEIKADVLDGEAQISAADYNPDDDRKLDDERRKVHDTQVHAGPPEQGLPVGNDAIKANSAEEDEDEYEEVEEDEEDDDFDMFAVDDAPKKKRKVLKKKSVSDVLCYSYQFLSCSMCFCRPCKPFQSQHLWLPLLSTIMTILKVTTVLPPVKF